jgi:hypothetical protein
MKERSLRPNTECRHGGSDCRCRYNIGSMKHAHPLPVQYSTGLSRLDIGTVKAAHKQFPFNLSTFLFSVESPGGHSQFCAVIRLTLTLTLRCPHSQTCRGLWSGDQAGRFLFTVYQKSGSGAVWQCWENEMVGPNSFTSIISLGLTLPLIGMNTSNIPGR